MPRLKVAFEKNENGKCNWLTISLSIILFLVGWILMLLLAYFEDDIQFDLTWIKFLKYSFKLLNNFF